MLSTSVGDVPHSGALSAARKSDDGNPALVHRFAPAITHCARHRRHRDPVHGQQELALFNAHYDSGCSRSCSSPISGMIDVALRAAGFTRAVRVSGSTRRRLGRAQFHRPLGCAAGRTSGSVRAPRPAVRRDRTSAQRLMHRKFAVALICSEFV
jgi:hypothetical protein